MIRITASNVASASEPKGYGIVLVLLSEGVVHVVGVRRWVVSSGCVDCLYPAFQSEFERV